MSSALLRKAFHLTIPFAFILLLATVSSAQLSLRHAMDYDNDGKSDLAVFRPTGGIWFIQRSTQGYLAQQFGIPTTDTPCPGDYDGDGKGDICVWRDTDGTFYYLRSSNGTIGVQQFGLSGDEPVARQWDGDGGPNNANGRTDFAVIRRTNNLMIWYILTNPASGTPQYSAVQFGFATDNPIPGDYDGDGKFDYAVQRAASASAPGAIYIQQSQDGFKSLQYGLGSDQFAPGDYDGDKKTDLCAVRSINGQLVWFVLNSSTNAITTTAFGSDTGDFLAQNDYDGDGKTDVAVWRDATGVFYIQGSMNGFQAIQFGAPNDFPVAGYNSY